MKRKFRVGLKIKFKNPNGMGVFVKKVKSWEFSRKERPWMINTYLLTKFLDFYYIYFRCYAWTNSPDFFIKEIFYEETN